MARFLDEDGYDIRVPSQNFACVSVAGPDLRQKTEDGYALKIRGVFATLDEAEKHCKLIQSIDPDFDVWTMEMWKWVPFPPKVTEIDPTQTKLCYSEEKLDELMKGYFEQQRKQKEIFEARKKAVMQDGLDAHLLPDEKVPPPREE